MLIRVGLPIPSPAMARAVEIDLDGAPCLMSANAFWDADKGRFRVNHLLSDLDFALDSGGFVAARRYGGYRWTPLQYAEFAFEMSPTWWASMDHCCEPEIAASPAIVQERIVRTVSGLIDCRRAAEAINDYLGTTLLAMPMPVLQGWQPRDYLRCVDWMLRFALDELPPLVGLGSVCRRPLHGANGLLRVIGTLDAHLPQGVQLHLFGVKSAALSVLADHPRIYSMDSCSWDMRERWAALREGRSRSAASRCAAMIDWTESQRRRVETRQLALAL